MTDKPFRTIDEQIDILKKRNLTIPNENNTKILLLNYGYYEIINGYKDPFLKQNTKDDIFMDNTTFDDIFHLFFADMKLRDAVMSSIEIFEAYICNITAYIFSKNHGSSKFELTNKDNFNRGKKNYRDGKFVNYERDVLFIKINNIINDNIEPFKHYRNKHNNVPAWIMVKGMTFGNIKTFIRLLKIDDKEELIKTAYKKELLDKVPMAELKGLMAIEMNFINLYRNRAAHGGRIYNYEPKKYIPYNYNLHNKFFHINRPSYRKERIGKNNFKTLILLLKCFDNDDPSSLLEENLNNVLHWCNADMNKSTVYYFKNKLGI